MPLKILTLNPTLTRLPIGLSQVKAGHTSENSLNQIHQITKKVYNQ